MYKNIEELDGANLTAWDEDSLCNSSQQNKCWMMFLFFTFFFLKSEKSLLKFLLVTKNGYLDKSSESEVA